MNAIQDNNGVSGQNQYIYMHGGGVDEIVAWRDYGNTGGTAGWYMVVADYAGSTVAIQKLSGTIAADVTDTYTYSAYGEVNNTTGFPFRYTGRRLDAETGLYYYRARYYSSILGRFLQTDPIGYGDGMNMYAYVGNDPVNGRDPSGEVGVVGFIAGVVADVAYQTIVEGKSLGEVDVGDALVAGVAGAAGLGILKQAGKVIKAAKEVRAAKKKVQRAKKYTDNKKAEGSRKKTRNAEFREGKAHENFDSTVNDAVGTTLGAAGAAVGVKVTKEALPDVTVNDAVDAIDAVTDTVADDIERESR